MSGAREEILRRVRDALSDVPGSERPTDVPVVRAYRRITQEPLERLLARFEDRLRDYGAEVARVGERTVGDGTVGDGTVGDGTVGEAVGAACSRRGLRHLVLPPGLPESWRPEAVELTEDGQLPARELDLIDGVLTGCAVAIAETGTIALDGGQLSGRRAISLVPDHHICVVRADQVVGSVPEGLHVLGPAVAERRAPITLISGPSASSDIGLSRVEGVHGPRHLLVLIVPSTALRLVASV